MAGNQRSFAEWGFAAVTLVAIIVVGACVATVLVFAHTMSKTTACATHKRAIVHAQEAYKASSGVYPPNMAALTNREGALLRSVSPEYTVDGRGNVIALANNPGRCT